jgi:hypothetical protein
MNNGFLAGASSGDTNFCKIVGISLETNTSPIFTWNPSVDFKIYFSVAYAFQTNDGGYFLSGYDYNLETTLAIKTNSTRQKLWTVDLDSLNRINACQQTTDNGFIILDGNGWLVKINNTGTAINFSTKISGATSFSSVCQINDVDGYIIGGSSAAGGCLIKILPNGAIATGWPKTFSGITYDIIAVRVAPDGGFVFITAGGDFVKTNANGSIIWNKKLLNCYHYFDNYYLEATNDGGFIVTNKYSNWVMKTDENGDTN